MPRMADGDILLHCTAEQESDGSRISTVLHTYHWIGLDWIGLDWILLLCRFSLVRVSIYRVVRLFGTDQILLDIQYVYV